MCQIHFRWVILGGPGPLSLLRLRWLKTACSRTPPLPDFGGSFFFAGPTKFKELRDTSTEAMFVIWSDLWPALKPLTTDKLILRRLFSASFEKEVLTWRQDVGGKMFLWNPIGWQPPRSHPELGPKSCTLQNRSPLLTSFLYVYFSIWGCVNSLFVIKGAPWEHTQSEAAGRRPECSCTSWVRARFAFPPWRTPSVAPQTLSFGASVTLYY